MQKRIYLIDGSGFIFRAFYALPKLTRSDGTPAGAVYGFIAMLLKLLEEKRSSEVEDHVAVIFDAGRHSFRNDLYPAYKANRDEPPEELRPQFALVREATRAMGLMGIELAGFEADDLIASYAISARADGFEVVIVSSDKDLMQLVNDAQHISMFDAMKDKPIKEAEVQEKFGVSPALVGEVLALMGDSSDNIPGVAGIGPKTAAELIQQFGSVEELLGRLGEIKQQKRRESLQDNADKARLSRILVRLKDDIPLPLPLADCRYHGLAFATLRPYLQQMEFKKLSDRVEKLTGASPVELPATPNHKTADSPLTLVTTEASLLALLRIIHEEGRVAVSLTWEENQLIGVALATTTERAYLPFGHLQKTEDTHTSATPASGSGDLFSFASKPLLADNQLPFAVFEKYLKPLFANAAILKLTWQGKEDIRRLSTCYNWQFSPIEDVCLLSYVLEAGLYGHDLPELATRHLHKPLPEITTVLGAGRVKITAATCSAEDFAPFVTAQAEAVAQLATCLKPPLADAHLLTIYERLERPLMPLLAQMERQGVQVDTAQLQSLSAEFLTLMRGIEQEIYALAGKEFLISSPKQCGELLFEHLNLAGGKKSKKSGQYSTGVEILEELAAQGHRIAEKILEWRQYDKLRNTYTEALVKQIHPQTGRIHTTFMQTVAATGRLSSTDPNLQNIPIRSEAGRRIRTAFIAASGKELISADYSQIELRLLAEMANIPTLKQAFRAGEDIHAATASQMFSVPLADVTSELRRRAKTINFGIIYGISAHGLAVRLGIDRATASRFIHAYFEHYPEIKHYMEAKKHEAQQNGFIQTLWGRKIHIKGIADSNFARRGFAERQAINAPLQGTAADIIKRAMLLIHEQWAVGENPHTTPQMLLQVHDELLFEVPTGTGQQFAPQIQKIMESAAHLSLPLTVMTGIGKDWGSIH
jgi:DNA polymerase-1